MFKRRFLAVMLLVAIVGITAIGLAQVRYYSPSRYRAMGAPVSAVRTSIASRDTESGIITVPANGVRLEQVTASGAMGAPEFMGEYYPFDVDAVRGYLIVEDGVTDKRKLYTIDADDAVTLLVDTGDHADLDKTLWPQALRVQTDGSYLLWLARLTSTAPDGTADCKVYRSTDAGVGWTLVHTNNYGGPAGSDKRLYIAAGKVLYGDYKDIAAAGDSRGHVYYSENYGVTWDEIYTRPDPEPDSGVWHWHGSVIDPDDASIIYVWYGDNTAHPWPPFIKLTKPAGWTVGDGAWTATSLTNWTAIDGMEYVSAGKWLVHQLKTWFYWPATGARELVFTPPRRQESETSWQYDYLLSIDYSRVVFRRGDEFYLPTSHYTADAGHNTGLQISTDAKHWTSIRRLDDTTYRGWKEINCDWNGYLWGWSEALADGHPQLFRVAAVEAKLVNAIRVDMPVTNRMTTRQNGTATTTAGAASLGNWSTDTPAPDAFEAVAGGSDDSGHCFHIQTDDAQYINYWDYPTYGNMGGVPTNGDYLVVSMEVWSPNYSPDCWAGMFNEHQGEIAGSSNILYAMGTARQRYIWSGRVTSAGLLVGDEEWGYIRGKDAATIHQFDVYFDNVQFAWDSTYWPTFSAYQEGGTPRTAEVVTIPISGLGTAWSVAFDWIGWASLELPGIPVQSVASLAGAGGTYIDVNVTAATEITSITDGTDTASLATAYRRLHWDQVRVVITCDGTDTELFVFDVLNGKQTAGNGTGVLLSGPPTAIKLGSNNAETVNGQGWYWGLQKWTKELTTAEIDAHFVAPGESVRFRPRHISIGSN